MTRDEVAASVIAAVLLREGGIVDTHDGKGVTRFGQTAEWLTQYGLTTPTTSDEAAANYREWLDRTRLIVLCDQPDALADIAIDWAVHAHAVTVIRAIQLALHLRGDGVLGPVTEAALQHANRDAMARRLLADRIRTLGRLITDYPDRNAQFAAGWLARVAAQVDALA